MFYIVGISWRGFEHPKYLGILKRLDFKEGLSQSVVFFIVIIILSCHLGDMVIHIHTYTHLFTTIYIHILAQST